MSDLCDLAVGGLSEAYRLNSTRPSEVLAALRERIDRMNPALGAITAVDGRLSDRAAAGSPAVAVADRMPLHGIPVAVKEMIAVEGMPYTAQSLTRAGAVADRDAQVVALLRSQGAMILGTTRTHELAWGITTRHATLGGTRNPWNPAFIAGGSSGGSAAAVASGMVPLALGTDTACSIRQPAAFTGICGFKPTHGLLSTGGVLPLAPSLDHVGILAREVADIAMGLSVLSSGRMSAVIPPLAADTRIGVARLTTGDVIGSAQKAAFADAARSAEARMIEVDWPHDPGVAGVFGVLQAREALVSHISVLGTWPEHRALYGADVRRRLEFAEAVGDAAIATARAELHGYAVAWDAALRDADVVILPATGSGPSRVDDPDAVEVDGCRVALRDAVIPWQCSANLIGAPACAVPIGLDAGGLPIGVQVIGRRGHDDLVLTVAAAVRDAMRHRLPAAPPKA